MTVVRLPISLTSSLLLLLLLLLLSRTEHHTLSVIFINCYFLLRRKAAQPLQMQHTVNKTFKKEKRLVRKSGKTVKQSIQISQMFLHYVRNVTSNKTFKEVL